MTVSILTERESCMLNCSNTSSLQTLGSTGDVRQCRHGRIWLYEGRTSRSDLWRLVSRWGNPFLYRRAVRALDLTSPERHIRSGNRLVYQPLTELIRACDDGVTNWHHDPETLAARLWERGVRPPSSKSMRQVADRHGIQTSGEDVDILTGRRLAPEDEQ